MEQDLNSTKDFVNFMLDVMKDVKKGTLSSDKANAIVKAGNTVLKTMEVQIKMEQHRKNKSLDMLQLPEAPEEAPVERKVIPVVSGNPIPLPPKEAVTVPLNSIPDSANENNRICSLCNESKPIGSFQSKAFGVAKIYGCCISCGLKPYEEQKRMADAGVSKELLDLIGA